MYDQIISALVKARFCGLDDFDIIESVSIKTMTPRSLVRDIYLGMKNREKQAA